MSLWRRLFYPDTYYAGPDDPLWTRARALEDELAAQDPFDLPTVVAARELVADTTAMMPLIAVAESTGERISPTQPVLRRPDPSETYRRSMERTVNGMTRSGRVWLYTTATGANGYPLSVEIVDDERVTARTNTAGRVVETALDGRPVDPASFQLVPMITDYREPLGRSPLDRIGLALEQMAEIHRFGASYYLSAQTPPYAIKAPNRLTAEQAGQLVEQWTAARMARRPALLSGGIELETYAQPSAADAMLLDAARYMDAVVARVMQIPPSLLNTESQHSLTYSTVAGEFQRWLTVGLHPMFLSRIEAAYTELLPRGQRAEFDTSPLTRLDMTTLETGQVRVNAND